MVMSPVRAENRGEDVAVQPSSPDCSPSCESSGSTARKALVPDDDSQLRPSSTISGHVQAAPLTPRTGEHSGSFHGKFLSLARHAWRPRWSAIHNYDPIGFFSRSQDSVEDPARVYALTSPSAATDVSLTTFTYWHGTLLRDLPGHLANLPAAYPKSKLSEASGMPRDDGYVTGFSNGTRYFLVRLTNIADPADRHSTSFVDYDEGDGAEDSFESDGIVSGDTSLATHNSDSSEEAGIEPGERYRQVEMEKRTVDMCSIVSWPENATLTVVETTLSANRRLKQFEESGGAFKFKSEHEAMCFKKDPRDCIRIQGSQAGRKGQQKQGQIAKGEWECGAGGGTIEAFGVDCSSQAVHVCIPPMHVRTFIVVASEAV